MSIRASDLWLAVLVLIAIASVLNQKLNVWSTDPFSIGLSILVILMCAIQARSLVIGQPDRFNFIRVAVITIFIILVIIKVVAWMLL